MAELVIGKPEKGHWVQYIQQRIKKNKNFLGFLWGETGSGKSWTSISIAEQLDEEFNIERIVFNGLELMKLINSGTLKKGSVIVFEEVGVAMNNRNWQSTVNKLINYLMQTFRHRNFILIMNAPFADFVDTATKKLFHAEFQTISINKNKQECCIKPLFIKWNSRQQKFYYKRLRVIMPKGAIPISLWDVKKPSDELIKAYECKKKKYTDKLNSDIEQELIAIENKATKKKSNELTSIQQETLDMLKSGLVPKQISEVRNRVLSSVHDSIKLIKKKGYEINPVYEGGNIVRYEVLGSEDK